MLFIGMMVHIASQLSASTVQRFVFSASTVIPGFSSKEVNGSFGAVQHTPSELYELYIHGYASLAICAVGSIGHVLSLVIFINKRMTTPKKELLGGLAAINLVRNLIYMPVIWYMFFHLNYFSRRNELPYAWAKILIWHSYISQVLFTMSVWLMITMAIFRYMAILHPLRYSYWCSIVTVKRIVVIGCIVSIIDRIPFLYSAFIPHSDEEIIKEYQSSENKNMPIGTNTELIILRMNKSRHWLYDYYLFGCCLLLHLLPSVVLAVFSCRLSQVLNQKKRDSQQSGFKIGDTEERANHGIKMVLVVLFMFLLTEIPQGILIILAHTIGRKFYEDWYSRMANFLDLLVLTTFSFDFVVYYFMYNRFRDLLKSLFLCRGKKEHIWYTT